MHVSCSSEELSPSNSHDRWRRAVYMLQKMLTYTCVYDFYRFSYMVIEIYIFLACSNVGTSWLIDSQFFLPNCSLKTKNSISQSNVTFHRNIIIVQAAAAKL